MATTQSIKKFRLPQAKILRFTLTGKSIPEELARKQDESRLRSMFGDAIYDRFGEAERAVLIKYSGRLCDHMANLDAGA